MRVKQILKNKELLIIRGIGIIGCLGLLIYAWVASTGTSADMKGFRYEIPLILGGLFLLIGSLFIIWLIWVKKAAIHNIYLGMAVVIFSLFLWVQPPGHTHDVQFHYDSGYVLSDVILGQKPEGLKPGKNRLTSYYRRECDQFMQYSHFSNYIQAYADIQNKMFSDIKADDTGLIEVKTYQGEVSVPLYFYLPQALGFTAARLLGLNVYWLMFLGRLFVCAACVILIYFSIKNIPFGKEILLLCGLIPTTMLSYASVSRDALILAVSFFFVSKCFQMTYSQRKNHWWDYGLLLFSLILLVPYKLVYIPSVILLGILIYRNCKRGIWDKKYIILFAAIFVLILGVFVVINFRYIESYLTGSNSYSMGEDAPFTLPYILANTGQAITVVIKTLLTSTVRYYANMIAIGDYGGGIRKEMVLVDSLFMVMLILLTNRPYRSEKASYKIAGVERFIIVFTWVSIGAIVIFAYLLCTPYTNDVIIGIQGRYFTPALPLMILSFCYIQGVKEIKNKYWNKMVNFLDRDIVKRSILLGIYGVSVWVIVNMYVDVITYVAPA